MKTLVVLMGFAALAAPAAAQTRQASAAVTVERAVGVSQISRMIFNATATEDATITSAATAPSPEETTLVSSRAMAADAPAVIRISGDPGRAYRINLPRSISDPDTNATITDFSVWSDNSGDITETLSARMDQTGRDTLRVSGVLSVVAISDVSAAVPITVNYE